LVHSSGIPWNDASGIQLRHWLGLERERFYDERDIAIVPMGFCYPGSGESGDLPPRPECAQTWHPRLLPLLPNVRLTLLIGHYAQSYVLQDQRGKTLTDTVRAYARYLPRYLPLPHPSPRNRLWLRNNPWFESDVLPELRTRVEEALA
jgi:uracil-DNA glycosylase